MLQIIRKNISVKKPALILCTIGILCPHRFQSLYTGLTSFLRIRTVCIPAPQKAPACRKHTMPGHMAVSPPSASWQDWALCDIPAAARIKAFTSDTKSVPVTSITLEDSVVIKPKEQKQLLLKSFQPSNATDLTPKWKTSNKKIAVVNKNGSLTAVSPGTCKITAVCSNGKRAVCKVLV